MNLFSFFKRRAKTNDAILHDSGEEYLPSLREDDYGQIEIVPIENKALILQQFRKIDAVDKDGAGLNEIVFKHVHPTPTFLQEIRAEYVENTLARYRFNKAKYIYFDGRKVLDCVKGNTKAFGFTEFTLFFDVEEDFIKEFWLAIDDIKSNEKLNLISEALFDIADGLDLVIVDWGRCEIIDLSDKVTIKRYLINCP